MQTEKPHYINLVLYSLAIVGVIIASVLLFSGNTPKDNKNEKENVSVTNPAVKNYASPPEMKIDTAKNYEALMKTNFGDIRLKLFASEAPVTVNNFVFLSSEGFYNGTVFHRIVKDFMIQGGDPQGTGRGGPGYKFNDEKITRDYKRGTLAMANSGPNTNGSQFFIMHKDYGLPKNYVIFGEVVEGIETVDKIAEVETTDSGSGEKSSPAKEVKIESVTVSEK